MKQCLLIAALVWTAAAAAEGQEWSRFRGPNGSGESEASIPAAWTERDYNWRAELPGKGESSPVVWGNKLFITSAEGNGTTRILVCLDVSSGKLLWKREFDSITHRIHQFNSYASSTPAVDAQRVYVAWTTPEHYEIIALDHAGKGIWRADLGPFKGEHGHGASPIVYGELVVVNNDQDGQSSLVALDRITGAVRWKIPRKGDMTAYSTPCVRRTNDGSEELIFNSSAHGITGIDPKAGAVNWELSVFDKRSVSSPVLVGGLVIGSCGSGGGGNYVVAVRPGEKPELAYKIDKSAPYVPTSVAHGELLFLWSENGVVSCVEAADGKVVWQQRLKGGGNFFGSPVRAGKHLYAISTIGDVVVLSASTTFEELGRNSLGEPSRATPAISGGQMFLRTDSHVFAIGHSSR